MELKYKVGDEVFDLVQKRVVKIIEILITESGSIYTISNPFSNIKFSRREEDLSRTQPDILLG